jgi:hypothetical protein
MEYTLQYLKQYHNILITNSVFRDSGCIEYTKVDSLGYGLIQSYKEGEKVHLLAHRLAYMLEHELVLTPEQIIMHSCDNPCCVNPNHLKLGTHNDNVQDKVNKNRQAKGTTNGRAKLNEEKVRIIRSSSNSNTELAKRYGVDAKVIRNVKQRLNWTHVV